MYTDNAFVNGVVGPIAQLLRKVANSSPTASRLTQPSIPPWVSKMSAWQMMVIGRICAFQIGSLHQLGNPDMAALVLYAPRELI